MEDKIHPSDLWSGGLIAVGLIILQGFFSSSSDDAVALVSIFAFAIAIPVLVCNLLMNFLRRKSGGKASIYEILFYGIGLLSAFVGITAAFWHTCRASAFAFVASSLVAFIVFLRVSRSEIL